MTQSTSHSITKLRTMLMLPANQERLIEQARDSHPDAILFDLADSVPEEEKEQARQQARAAIAGLHQEDRQIWVRINSSYTNLSKLDIQAVLTPEVDGILLPQSDSAAILRYVEALVRDQEARTGIESGKTRLIAVIETAEALLHCESIALASPRLIGLAFDANCFTSNMGIERTPGGAELLYARSVIGVAAHAAKLMALDTLYDGHGADGLMQEARQVRQAGFAGMWRVHPEQIDAIAAVFTREVGEPAGSK